MPFADEGPPTAEPDPELNALTSSAIGAAIEVHKQLGPGLDEACYEAALAIELRLRGIPFRRQVFVRISYKGEPIGDRRIDFIVGDRVVVELKAVEELAKVHMAQVKTYLKLTNLTLGLLTNFNTAVLKDGLKRIIRT